LVHSDSILDKIDELELRKIMNILQIVAHPVETSFTAQLAESFKKGAESNGHQVLSLNLFRNDVQNYSVKRHQDLVSVSDVLCFAYPNMWEMPPAELVRYFQTVFVKDFAFRFTESGREVLLSKKVLCLISLGQNKMLKHENLAEAMKYCGLEPNFYIFQGVGPNLTKDKADQYIKMAYDDGDFIKG
jgi:putative NADPH-quinone reductase